MCKWIYWIAKTFSISIFTFKKIIRYTNLFLPAWLKDRRGMESVREHPWGPLNLVHRSKSPVPATCEHHDVTGNAKTVTSARLVVNLSHNMTSIPLNDSPWWSEVLLWKTKKMSFNQWTQTKTQRTFSSAFILLPITTFLFVMRWIQSERPPFLKEYARLHTWVTYHAS